MSSITFVACNAMVERLRRCLINAFQRDVQSPPSAFIYFGGFEPAGAPISEPLGAKRRYDLFSGKLPRLALAIIIVSSFYEIRSIFGETGNGGIEAKRPHRMGFDGHIKRGWATWAIPHDVLLHKHIHTLQSKR